MHDERVAYVVRQLERGVSAESLAVVLLDAGYTEDQIETLFIEAEQILFGDNIEPVDTGYQNNSTESFVSGLTPKVESILPNRLSTLLPILAVFVLIMIFIGLVAFRGISFGGLPPVENPDTNGANHALFDNDYESPVETPNTNVNDHTPFDSGYESPVEAAEDPRQPQVREVETSDAQDLKLRMSSLVDAINNSSTSPTAVLQNQVVHYEGLAAFGDKQNADELLQNPAFFSDVSFDLDLVEEKIYAKFFNFRNVHGDVVEGILTTANPGISDATYAADVSGQIVDNGKVYDVAGVIVGQVLGDQVEMIGGGLAARYTLDEVVFETPPMLYASFGAEITE